WTASRLGMVKGLRTINRVRLQKTLILQDKKLLLAHLNHELDEIAQDLKQRLHDLSTRFEQNANCLLGLVQDLKRASAEKKTLLALEIRHLKRELKVTWRAWVSLTTHASKRYQVSC